MDQPPPPWIIEENFGDIIHVPNSRFDLGDNHLLPSTPMLMFLELTLF